MTYRLKILFWSNPLYWWKRDDVKVSCRYIKHYWTRGIGSSDSEILPQRWPNLPYFPITFTGISSLCPHFLSPEMWGFSRFAFTSGDQITSLGKMWVDLSTNQMSYSCIHLECTNGRSLTMWMSFLIGWVLRSRKRLKGNHHPVTSNHSGSAQTGFLHEEHIKYYFWTYFHKIWK